MNINFTKYLLFEINDECQLTHVHKSCPRNCNRFRSVKHDAPITIPEIISFSKEFLGRGFDGHIGFHYYNEPLCTPEKILEIVKSIPSAKFTLWTNGINLEKNKYLLEFIDDVMVTIYPETKKVLDIDSLRREYPKIRYQPAMLDGRIESVDEKSCKFNPSITRCGRVNMDLSIDYYGNIHYCCGDWSGGIDIGNVKVDSFLSFWNKLDKFVSRFPNPWDENSYKLLPSVCKVCIERKNFGKDVLEDK